MDEYHQEGWTKWLYKFFKDQMGDGGEQTRSNADIGDEIENSEVNFVYIDNKF